MSKSSRGQVSGLFWVSFEIPKMRTSNCQGRSTIYEPAVFHLVSYISIKCMNMEAASAPTDEIVLYISLFIVCTVVTVIIYATASI